MIRLPAPARSLRALIPGSLVVALLGAPPAAFAQGSPPVSAPGSGSPGYQQPLPTWAQPQRPPQQQQQAPKAAPNTSVIALVGGRAITQVDFDRIAQPYFLQLRAQLGQSLAGDVEKMAKFNVLDELVRRELLAVEAERQKVVATQEDVDSLLVRDPFFYTNGQFDAGKFASYKTSPGSNYAQVLPQLREMAAIRKLDESLRKRFTPSPAQLREEWNRRNDQVRIQTLALLTRDMSLDPEATEAEWATYFQAHPDQFMRKTRARLRYARLPIPIEGDSLRATAEAAAMTRGRAIADSLRRKTLPDTSAQLTDTGLFEIPATALPGLGRVPGLTDTLSQLDQDSTIQVVGPYPAQNAVIVGVVTERQPRHLPAMREVLGEVKRRADADKRRTTNEADRRAFYEARRDQWRGRRAAITRIVFDPASLTMNPPAPAEVDRWYAQHGRLLYGMPDTSRAWLPPISDSLRTVTRERMIAEQRAMRGVEIANQIAAEFRSSRDPRALAKKHGAAAETLSFLSVAPSDTLFGRTFIDSLLAGAMGVKGTIQGPRNFGTRWASWRVDAADTAFVPPYETVRGRSDQEFAEDRRQKDETEARAHFEPHRGDYKTPVRYGIDYVLVRVPPEDSIKITEAEIKRRYDQNRNSYRVEEQVKARHILFMAGRDTDGDKKARARADSLLAAIRKDGGDFADLARRFSQEPGASTSGGDLGWFGRGRMVKDFEDAAFVLKPGEISPVVKTQFGYHIIRVEEKKAAGVRPYAEVRDEIRTQMAQARADTSARRSADALRRKLSAGGDAKALSARYGGVVTANPIAANDALPAIGFVSGLPQELPALKVGKWAPHVYRGGNAWMVLRVREKVAPRPAEFDEVKTQAIEDMKNAKRRALLEKKVEAVRTGLTAGATLDSLAAPYGGLRDSGLLTQSAGFVPPVGNEPRVLARAFAMKPGEQTDTLQVAAGVAWMRVVEKKAGDPAGYKAAAGQIEAEMVKKKYDTWIEEKKKTIPIQIVSAELKGPRPNPFGGLSVSTGR